MHASMHNNIVNKTVPVKVPEHWPSEYQRFPFAPSILSSKQKSMSHRPV